MSPGRPDPPGSGAPMTTTSPADPPDMLAGFTVAVTSDRRHDELATLLEAHGARVVLAPALRLVLVADEMPVRFLVPPPE